MTWIRWECSSPRHPIFGRLAQALGIHRKQAYGHYVATCCGFGDHQPDGVAVTVNDITLEEWADWPGPKGRWAESFRRLCLETEPDQADAVGVVKGWWRNESTLRKQEKDRHKRRPTREEPPENPRETPTGSSGYVVRSTLDVNDRTTTTTTGAADSDPRPVEPVEYAKLCTIAVNKALRTNPTIGTSFRELAASNNFEQAREWQSAGIPIDVATDAIVSRIAEMDRPRGNTQQPHNLKYFDQRVRDAWEAAQLRAREGEIQPGPAVNGKHPPADPVDRRLDEWVRAESERRGINAEPS